MRVFKCFLPVFLLCAIGAQAQFKKGDRMVGASVASLVFNSGNSDISVAQIGSSTAKITSYNVAISPSVGWFISDNTAVGGTVIINPAGNKTSYEQNGNTFESNKYNSFNIGLGGFVRHYLNSSGNLMPFGQFGFNVGISNLKTEGFDYSPSTPLVYKETYTGSSSGGFFANASIQGGVTKMLGENAGLDFSIGYNYGYSKNDFTKTTLYYLSSTDTSPTTGKNETTTKYTNHGFLLGVGFQVFLRKKK